MTEEKNTNFCCKSLKKHQTSPYSSPEIYSMIILQREIHTEKNSFLRKLVFLGYVQAPSFLLCFTQAMKSQRNLTTEQQLRIYLYYQNPVLVILKYKVYKFEFVDNEHLSDGEYIALVRGNMDSRNTIEDKKTMVVF